MTHLDPVRPTSRHELRKFGLLVGGAFLALAAIALWRHRSTVTAGTFGVLGGLLVLGGLTVPEALRAVYAGWMRFALALSKITTPIFMSVIYFVVLTPTGWIMRLFGWRPFGAGATSAWVTRDEGKRTSALERQF